MPPEKDEGFRELISRYREKLKSELDEDFQKYRPPDPDLISREYEEFKRQYLPRQATLYEKVCNLSEKLLKITPDRRKIPDIMDAIRTSHLDITPAGVATFAILGPVAFMLLGSMLSFFVLHSMFFILFSIIAGLVLMLPLGKVPQYLANSWRLKTSNQMVIAIFYIVTYMRHTSNMENAMRFASDHVTGPLALDLKKVLWDVGTEHYDSLKDALDDYLKTWKKWNIEFIESIHLIQSSLYEGQESRRLDLLDKSLSVMLEETYEKMLHYAQNLKSPITMLHMLGVILPVLGLVILPLMVNFIGGVEWYHIAMLYNVTLPIIVYYMGKNVLQMRPTGYGDTDIAEFSPEIRKYRNIVLTVGNSEVVVSPLWICVFIVVIGMLIGFSPVIVHILEPGFDMSFMDGTFQLIGYRPSSDDPDRIIGPYGIGATLLSLFIPLSLGLAIGVYYFLGSRNVMKIRDRAKKLEKEFASALFQLGNRLGDGIPAEVAFEKVAYIMEGTISGNFFTQVATNIRKLGMSVKRAIFDVKIGAIRSFPSKLIDSSMKVLIEASRKGPKIAAAALMNISRYVNEIHRVNERLKDLLADIISSMKSQIKFLTPVISGIVAGITSMITTIIIQLSGQLKNLDQTGGSELGVAGAGSLPQLFGDGIPTFWFQIVVGLYVVQITYILTVLENGIENGSDKLYERYLLGRNLLSSTVLYVVVSFFIIIIFNMIAGQIMQVAVTT